MRVAKAISFSDEFLDELAHLEKQGNQSHYVCMLIRRDRLRPSFRDEVEDIIEQKLNRSRQPRGPSVLDMVSDTFDR